MGPLLLLPEQVERAVVEHVAVLVDLDERAPPVGGRLAQHLREVLAVVVHRPRDERRLRAEGQRDRIERVVHRAERGRLGDLALLRGWRVLALGQAVDLVVEQEDLQVHVPAEGVDQMVAADRQTVAVTGDDPHRQVGSSRRDARRERRRAPVDAVHAVRIHVVGEPARTPDPRDEHRVVRLDAELRHEPLDRRQDRVVTAARAPADLLVAGEVLLRQGPDPGAAVGADRTAVAAVASVARVAHPSITLFSSPPTRVCSPPTRKISSSNSSAKIGCPCTLENVRASTR